MRSPRRKRLVEGDQHAVCRFGNGQQPGIPGKSPERFLQIISAILLV
jgi:hypothetical protein